MSTSGVPWQPALRGQLLGHPVLGDPDGHPVGERRQPEEQDEHDDEQRLHGGRTRVTGRPAGRARPGRTPRAAARPGRPARTHGASPASARAGPRRRPSARPRRSSPPAPSAPPPGRAPRRRPGRPARPDGSASPAARNVTAAPASTDTTRPRQPARHAGRQLRAGQHQVDEVAGHQRRADGEQGHERPVGAGGRAADQQERGQRADRAEEQHADRRARRRGRAGAGGTSAGGRRRGSPGRRRRAGRPRCRRSGSTRARSAATAAAAPTASDPANPWMPVASTQASDQPELQHQDGGQPADVAEELRAGRRAGATATRGDRAAAGRWWARAGSADSRAGGSRVDRRRSPACRSARRRSGPIPARPPTSPGELAAVVRVRLSTGSRQQRALRGHVGYPAPQPRQRRRRTRRRRRSPRAP